MSDYDYFYSLYFKTGKLELIKSIEQKISPTDAYNFYKRNLKQWLEDNDQSYDTDGAIFAIDQDRCDVVEFMFKDGIDIDNDNIIEMAIDFMISDKGECKNFYQFLLDNNIGKNKINKAKKEMKLVNWY